MPGPVGGEADLRHVAGIGPFGGDQFGALGRLAVDQHHVGVLGVDLVERVPDEVMVVEVEAAGQGDLRARGEHDLGVGLAAGGEEIAAVDHGRGQMPVVDHRSIARAPGRAGVLLVAVGSLVAHQFGGVSAFDQGLALGGEILELDRLDLGAVLFALEAALGLLVVVQLPLDPQYGAVEDIGDRPEQVVEVGFEACVGQGGDEGVEDVGDRSRHVVAFGKRSRIGLVGEGTPAIELEFGEHVLGRGRCVVRFGVVVLSHGKLPSV